MDAKTSGVYIDGGGEMREMEGDGRHISSSLCNQFRQQTRLAAQGEEDFKQTSDFQIKTHKQALVLV